MSEITVPFTEDQVESLNAYQIAGTCHPFTCGCSANLIATEQGWVCNECDNTQDWAHTFMADWSWNKNPIVNFEDTKDFVVFGEKTLKRKEVDLEPFFDDLQELVDSDKLNETPKLYKKYPDVRVGIRRALLVLEKRKRKEDVGD